MVTGKLVRGKRFPLGMVGESLLSRGCLSLAALPSHLLSGFVLERSLTAPETGADVVRGKSQHLGKPGVLCSLSITNLHRLQGTFPLQG